MEPGQHLLLPPPGGRRDAGAGDRLLARHRPGGPRPGACAGARGDLPARVRAHLVLRQCRHPLRRGAREAARDGPDVGGDRARALRRGRRRLPALSLRRPGQLARADRGPAREQHHSDRARGARRDHGPLGSCAGAAAAGLERGARPAAALGSAVVAAHPADPRLRDRPARISRHLRGVEGDGGPGRGARVGRERGDGRCGRAWRRGGGRALHEDAARRVAPRAHAPDRGRGASRGRPEHLHRGRALAASGGRGRRDPARRPGCGALLHRRAGRLALGSGRGSGGRCARPARQGGRRPRGQSDARDARGRGRRGHDGRVGRGPASGLRRVPGADRGRRRGGRAVRRCAGRASRPRRARVRGPRAPGEDPGWKAGPGRPLERRRADRRARPRRGHGRGLRRAFASRPRASPAPRSTRACTWWACRSSPARTRS